VSIYSDAKRQQAGKPEVQHSRPQSPLPAGVVTANSVRTDTPPPLFPVDIFPSWLAAFVSALSIATQDAALCSGDAVPGGDFRGTRGKIRYLVRRGWVKAANLFVVVAMESGSGSRRSSKPYSRRCTWRRSWPLKRLSRQSRPLKSERAILEARLSRRRPRQPRPRNRPQQGLPPSTAKDLAVQVKEFVVPPVPGVPWWTTRRSKALARRDRAGGRAYSWAEGTAFEMRRRYADSENFDVYLKGPWMVTRCGNRQGGSRASSHDAPALTCALAVQSGRAGQLGRSAKARVRGSADGRTRSRGAGRLPEDSPGPVPAALRAGIRNS